MRADVETARRLDPVSSMWRVGGMALWSARRAALEWQALSSPHRTRALRGWLEVSGAAEGPRLRHARLWLFGSPIWEFEFRAQDLRSDGGNLGAEAVFLDRSVVPLWVRTPLGLVRPATEPRIIDHPGQSGLPR